MLMTVSLPKTFPAASFFLQPPSPVLRERMPEECSCDAESLRARHLCVNFSCWDLSPYLTTRCYPSIRMNVWGVIISKLAERHVVQLWVMWKECGFLPNRNDLLCVRYPDRQGEGKTISSTWIKSNISIFGQISFVCVCGLYTTLDMLKRSFHFIQKLREEKETSGGVAGTRLPSGLVMWWCKMSDDVFCALAQFGNSCRLFWTSAPQSVPECLRLPTSYHNTRFPPKPKFRQ